MCADFFHPFKDEYSFGWHYLISRDYLKSEEGRDTYLKHAEIRFKVHIQATLQVSY